MIKQNVQQLATDMDDEEDDSRRRDRATASKMVTMMDKQHRKKQATPSSSSSFPSPDKQQNGTIDPTGEGATKLYMRGTS